MVRSQWPEVPPRYARTLNTFDTRDYRYLNAIRPRALNRPNPWRRFTDAPLCTMMRLNPYRRSADTPPIPHRLVRQNDAALGHELFDIPIAEAEAEVEPDTVADDLGWEAMAFVEISSKLCGHPASMPHKAGTEEVANLI
jgi:hypothetical protein